ncbi:MAG: redoxin family protein, partial [Candidatus Dormibacteria bacterium]
MRQYRWLLAGVVCLVAAAVIVVSAHPGADPESLSTATMGTTIPLESRTPAPELTGLDGWINSPPLTLAGLRGRVVLIDFWTFSCVNCVRTLPHLEADDQRYRDQGLVTIGVHSPEFDFEKSSSNVAAATRRLHVTYPVALDSHMNTWNAYGNQYWPAQYLIDRQGRVAAVHVGEGDYEATERNIVSLLGGGASLVPGSQPSDAPLTGSRTPEL